MISVVVIITNSKRLNFLVAHQMQWNETVLIEKGNTSYVKRPVIKCTKLGFLYKNSGKQVKSRQFMSKSKPLPAGLVPYLKIKLRYEIVSPRRILIIFHGTFWHSAGRTRESRVQNSVSRLAKGDFRIFLSPSTQISGSRPRPFQFIVHRHPVVRP